MPYTTIDHTADIGIRVTAPDLKGLFVESAMALISELGAATRSDERAFAIEVDGYDHEDLLIVFLNALLYEIQTNNLRISRLDVENLSETEIKANITGRIINTKLSRNIKAATYHNLSITKSDCGYSTAVILDV